MSVVTSPLPSDRAADRPWTPLEQRAARVGAGAAIVLVYAALAFAAALPALPAATALAGSIGLLSGLLVMLQPRRRLCSLWADLTAWIGLVFLCGNAWNLAARGFTIVRAIDVGLGAYLVAGGFVLARAARGARDAG